MSVTIGYALAGLAAVAFAAHPRGARRLNGLRGAPVSDEALCDEHDALAAAFRDHLWSGAEPDAAWDTERHRLQEAREAASDACWRLLDKQQRPKAKKSKK